MELYPRTFTEEHLTPEVFSARRESEHLHYSIVRCANCGLVFSREILPDDRLSELYAGSSVTFGEHMAALRTDYWRCLQPFLAGAHRGSALEIGCSSGFFLEELMAQGFTEVHGCEPSTKAGEMAVADVRKNIRSGLFGEAMYEPRKFDLVCSFHTFDHMSDPAEVVSACHEVLKPGGLVYVITHDVRSLQAIILGEKSPIIDVEHVYLFNKQTLRKLFERTGFDVLSVSGVRNTYPLDYWLHMMPLPHRVKGTLRGSLNRIGAGAITVPIKAGNIFIVARRKSQ